MYVAAGKNDASRDRNDFASARRRVFSFTFFFFFFKATIRPGRNQNCYYDGGLRFRRVETHSGFIRWKGEIYEFIQGVPPQRARLSPFSIMNSSNSFEKYMNLKKWTHAVYHNKYLISEKNIYFE